MEKKSVFLYPYRSAYPPVTMGRMDWKAAHQA